MSTSTWKVSAVAKIFVVVSALAVGGCSAATTGAFLEGFARGMEGAYTPGLYTSARLLVYGGQNSDTFLGCLNCSEYSAESVLNQYGSYGSAYGGQSIHNRYSDFGSQYSASSACNEYASDPPVVVDDQGNFYGHLTLNRYNNQIPDTNMIAWLTGVCSN